MEDAVIEARRAHDALQRSRSQMLAQREALETQLARVEAAIEALRELVDISPEPTASREPPVLARPEASPKADVAADDSNVPKPEQLSGEAVQTTKPVSRKGRIREIMLESPDDWFTAAEMAHRIENGTPSDRTRTATYEMMRRMAKQGELELNNSSKPTTFHARPATIRERLLADGH